jgi:hypothetical protein
MTLSLPKPDFVVVDVETACARVSSICQIGIVGFRDGAEIFAWDTLVDPCDEFSAFNIGIHGITPDHVTGQPTFADIHAMVDGHLGGRSLSPIHGSTRGLCPPPAGSARPRPSRRSGSTACAWPSWPGRSWRTTGSTRWPRFWGWNTVTTMRSAMRVWPGM